MTLPDIDEQQAVRVVRCGTVPYAQAWDAQRLLAAARQDGEVEDLLLLLEHPPVYTRGRRSQPQELPMGEDWYRAQGIEICDSDRGGAVTYHGPGQLVGYPIVSLRDYGNRAARGREAEHVARIDVVDYVRRMERLMIESLGAWDVEASVREGLTGVWVGERKIGSIGVHVSRGVTTHGFAVNVDNDLQPFDWIVPCGIEHCQMTSLSRELGAQQGVDEFAATVAERFGEIYERDPRPLDPAELAAQVKGIEALASAATVRA